MSLELEPPPPSYESVVRQELRVPIQEIKPENKLQRQENSNTTSSDKCKSCYDRTVFVMCCPCCFPCYIFVYVMGLFAIEFMNKE